jgi:hypothetical protein
MSEFDQQLFLLDLPHPNGKMCSIAMKGINVFSLNICECTPEYHIHKTIIARFLYSNNWMIKQHMLQYRIF